MPVFRVERTHDYIQQNTHIPRSSVRIAFEKNVPYNRLGRPQKTSKIKKALSKALTDSCVKSTKWLRHMPEPFLMSIIQLQSCCRKKASSDPPSAEQPTEHRFRTLP